MPRTSARVQREFVDTVESMAAELGEVVFKFVSSPGGYRVAPGPADVMSTLEQALHSGVSVRVTCDVATLEIVDAIVA